MYNILFRQTPKFGAGFTLIELLVVIAIIGILASIVMVSLSSARAKSRDVRRLSDLQQISRLFSLNYEPKIQMGGFGIQQLNNAFVSLNSNFSPTVPGLLNFKDISGATTPCNNTSTSNCAYSLGDLGVMGGAPNNPSSQKYIVCARLETNSGPLEGQIGGPGGPVSVSDKSISVVPGCVY